MTQPDPTPDTPDHTDATGSMHSEQDLRRWIVARLAAAAGTDPSQIDPSATFASLGVDSVAAVELVADLETELGRELDPTLVYSAETPSQLATVVSSGTSGRGRRRRASTPDAATGRVPVSVDERIAVVGIGCRFPGAGGPDAYWRMLLDGVDAVGDVPDGRWEPDPSLPASVNLGGFVEGIEQFDPAFFGITQLEADRMDPQQRMLLEVAWEALEDSAVKPSTLRGTDVGVFVGISTNEYSRRQSASPELIDVFFGTGNALSIAANRISYALDLHGPSIAIDTACSSSLVAVHLACASLRRGECSSALAGGANAILTPLLTLNFSGAGVIAPDGRCKTFDASADGIVRGEGAGLVHLKRLSDAVADGDRIHCVIEGSATNQDGRSNGLTAPDPDAQIDVFSAACEAAGVDPLDVDYVEAHGTGTVLGDAMELRSLDAVYGAGRPDDAPLLVGSVKTNIGHLESAAGIAGLVKAALSIGHATIPPTLHYREPNPYLAETNHVRVADEVTAWDREGTRRAAVSGFGFGGTNAHMILSSPPESPAATTAADTAAGDRAGPILLPLSARSAEALTTSVQRHATVLAEAPEEARDLAAAQALTRDEHPRRVAVVGADGEALTAALGEVGAGRRHGSAVVGDRRSSEPARVAFLFSGQGRAWWPFDAELLADPVIASVLRTCDSELREIADFSMLELIRSGEAVMDHERAQPLLFALQVALAARWRAFGVEPDLIVGQSIGEIAAAHVAGAIPLADALEIVHHRGRLMEESNGTGYTAFVELPAAEVATMIAELGLDVAIAAVTAPDNCVVSGPKPDTVAIVEAATGRGVMAQVFDVGDIPGHGPLMAPYAEKLTAAVDFLDPRPTSIPIISSVTAGAVRGAELDADYWGRNLRQQVRLLEAIEVAVDQGTELFIEIAPHPVVSFSTRRTLEALGSDARVQHTIKQGEPGASALLRSLAAAWVAGATVDWRAVTGRSRAQVRALPYPWDNRRCWFDLTPATRPAAETRSRSGWHPGLDDGEVLGGGTTTFHTLGGPTLPGGVPVDSPGAMLELAFAAVRSATGSEQVALTDVRLASGPDPNAVARTGTHGLSVSVSTRPDDIVWWVTTTGQADDPTRTRILARGSARPLRDVVPEITESSLLGTGEGSDEHTAFLTVEIPTRREGTAGWAFDPTLLDAVLRGSEAFGPDRSSGGSPRETSRIGEVVLLGAPAPSSRVVIDRHTGDATVLDEWGAPVLEVHDLATRAGAPAPPPGDLVLPVWTDLPHDLPASDDPERSAPVYITDDEALASELADRFGDRVVHVTDAIGRIDTGERTGIVLVGEDPTDLDSILSARGAARRALRILTRGGRSSHLVPDLIRRHPELDLRSVDVDDEPGSTAALFDLLDRRAAAQVVSIREGRPTAGRLEATPVPDVVRRTSLAGVRGHHAVWGDDTRIHTAPLTVEGDVPGNGHAVGTDHTPGSVRIRVDRALIAGYDVELAVTGEPAGVAAVGIVTDGPTELRDRTVAVVAAGAAATSLQVGDSRVWPVPDADTGVGALLHLLAMHPDLLRSVERDPETLAATFEAMAAARRTGTAATSTLAAALGTRPNVPTVVTVGDPETPLEETAHRWVTTGRWAVLAAVDDPFADLVVDWLRDRGAEVVGPDADTADGDGLAGVFAIGAVPVDRLATIEAPVVWIGPSSLLLGGAAPRPDEVAVATHVDSRRARGLATTTFLVGVDVDHTASLAVLDRVLLSGVETAVYDPAGRAALEGDSGTPGGWFTDLTVVVHSEVPAPVDDSVAAILQSAPASEHLGIVAALMAAEIATIIGIAPDDIDHDEPVDTYGVDSLVGMEMRSRIQATFAYEVPLSELSRTMTVTQLSTHLVEHAVQALITAAVDHPDRTDGHRTGAVEVQGVGSAAVSVQRGDGPTTWWIPGIFGSAAVYGPLGHELADHDVWAVEPTGDPATSVAAAAGAHLRTIRDRQGSGPYRIGGYSYGALVAVEVAIALESSGETVEHVWLLDPPPPYAPDDSATRAHRKASVAELLTEHISELFGTGELGVEELPDLTADADLDPLVERIVGAGQHDRDRVAAHLDRLWRTVAASLDAMATHRPTGVVTAPADLVIAERSGVSGTVADADWSHFLAGAAAPTAFDTDHAGLLQPPHASAVAEMIRRSLGAATRRRAAVPEDQMTTHAPPDTLSRRARSAIVTGLTTSRRSRSAVGALGNAYRQADFFLRALGAERRFRRNCVPGDDFIVGDHAQIINLSGDPERIRFGDHCLVDGFINLQEHGYFTMGSYCGIGVDARIDCSGYVEIGNGCTMAEGVYIIDGLHHPILVNERIGHGIDLFQGDHVMDAYGTGTETSFVRIEDLVWVGLRAIILSGVTIGRGSVIAAGAVVSQDVPPFSVVAGNPGRVVGRIPAEEFDIESHPTYRAVRGLERLPDNRRPVREVLEEIAARVAARR